MGEILLSEPDRKKVEASFEERRAAFYRELRQDEAAFNREVLEKKSNNDRQKVAATVALLD
jgi:hypothetical protein